MISVVIPNHNGARTIGASLESVFASRGVEFEVIVADDGSTDDSRALIARHPCRLLTLTHAGAAAARNAGAAAARGRWLFFTDADCVLAPDTLGRVRDRLEGAGPRTLLGGTYAVEPFDPGFFSRFQAVFIHHAETRRPRDPDYVATHAMALEAAAFRESGGFDPGFLPILEDVEFSHRLRRAGWRLELDPQIQVRHIFGFTLRRSLANAARKTRFWIRYSLGNRDLLADSGTASRGLKLNGALFAAAPLLAAAALALRRPGLLLALLPAYGVDLLANLGLVRAFARSHGPAFGIAATAYYLFLYPAGIAAGVAAGLRDMARTPRRRGGAG